MALLVTGAGGFVGDRLVARLAEQTDRPVRLVDRHRVSAPDARFEAVVADISEPDSWDALLQGVTAVIHMAAMPGGASEADPAGSRRVNLDATLALFDALAARPEPVRLVYASTIGVFGTPMPAIMDDDSIARPDMTYGEHKLMCEMALADHVRRGSIDGVALRLPGIVARARAPNGLKSAFISDVFHAVAAGEHFTMPVSPDATMWLMSVRQTVDMLIHAVLTLDVRAGGLAAMTLPALRVRVGDVVDRLISHTGSASRVSYQPGAALEALFGRMPELRTPAAEAAGFRHDGDLDVLIAAVLADMKSEGR